MNTQIFRTNGDGLALAGRWEWSADAIRSYEQARAHGVMSFRCTALPPGRVLQAGGKLQPVERNRFLSFEILHEQGRAPDNVALIVADDETLETIRQDRLHFRAA